MTFATFSASDAAVLVALIGAFAALAGPIVVLLVSSLKRIRAAAETAVHNTQPNGQPDAQGNRSDPSPYDQLIRSHEYTIGLIHSVAEEARAAAWQAARARVLAQEAADKAAAIDAKVDAGFAAATEARQEITERLDRNAERLERTELGGAQFVEVVAAGALEVLGRLDAIDGKETADELRARIAGTQRPEEKQ